MPSLKTLPRISSFAKVLNELDKVKLDLVELDQLEPEKTNQQKEHTQEAAPAPSQPEVAHASATNLPIFDAALFGIALAVGAALVLGYTDASAIAIPVCLISLALALLGTATFEEVLSPPRSGGGVAISWKRVPLTDVTLSLETANKFANSTQVREKLLKIVQYVLRMSAYSGLLLPPVATQLKTLSKTTSIARRFFKFCRWVKHFDDVAAARIERDSKMRLLLVLRGCANLLADWSEDICSLERIGVLPGGMLPMQFQLAAEYCQLALALVEVSVSAVMIGKQRLIAALMVEKIATGSANWSSVLKAERQLAMLRLELIKFVSDIGKAVHDCELFFAHEGVFLACSLLSALLSTHKNMVKVLNK